MKYLDNRLRDSDSFMGHWLENHIKPDILGIELQFGYFNFKALEPFVGNLCTAGENGARIHFVLGANQRQLSESDLHQGLELIECLPDASLTVVSFANGLFHPKVALVETAENEFACLVGSGNLTSSGLSKNIEAFLAINTTDDECLDIVKQIRDATTYWRSEPSPTGAFPVREAEDIRDLLKRKIISTDEERKQIEHSQRESTGNGLTSLRNDWKPARRDQTKEDWIKVARQKRNDLGEIIDYADVELFDGKYRLARFHHRIPQKTNFVPISINLKSLQVSRANKTFLHRVIDETGLDQTMKYRKKKNATGPETGHKSLTTNIIKKLKIRESAK